MSTRPPRPSPNPAPAPLLAHASRRWVRALPYAVALVLVAILLPSTVMALTHDFGLNGAVAGPLAVAQTGPLLLAVVQPLRAWGIALAADVAGALALLGTPADPLNPWPWPAGVIVGYLALCLAVAVRARRRVVVAVWLTTAVCSLVLGLVRPHRENGTGVLLVVLSAVVLLLGAAVRERADAQRRLAEQETISGAERARRTLLEERARIARELHDVVAHHMSVITVQADSAPYRLVDLPAPAREEFQAIAATARESLGEMRRLLGVLRSEDGHGERAPQPGLDRLAQLVEATVRAGVPARLAPVPEVSGVPQAVQLSAYRVVQEALANVVRHAPGAGTRVSVDREEAGGEHAAALTVRVVNAPSPRPVAAPLEAEGTGHGLVGMRERVRLLGGSLEAGPLPDGGFRVAARLPLAPSSPETPGTPPPRPGKETSPS